MKKIKIMGNMGKVLKLLGTLYRNPADAIKEHVSNAMDEHLKRTHGVPLAAPPCVVTFSLDKDKIVVEYPYGMSKDEFEEALQRVADSAKPSLHYGQIGRLGIGMFSFMAIGRKCVFISKKGPGYECVKVVLREGADEAEFAGPIEREKLVAPGIKITISELLFDPTKLRGPLAAGRLEKMFATTFDKYLREGTLVVVIRCQGVEHNIEAAKIDLPRLGEGCGDCALRGDPSKRFSLELYFDPSGKGRVRVRHMGVVVVTDVRELVAYGLEESVYADGHITGNIDADFLAPLPARAGFEENDDWLNLLDELDRLRPAFEKEVDKLKQLDAERKLTEIQARAIELAREILDSQEFQDLELLEGLGRKPREPLPPAADFGFVPGTARIDCGETGMLPLKAVLAKMGLNSCRVAVKVSDPECVKLLTDNCFLKLADADDRGVVTAQVRFQGLLTTSTPVILTASSGSRVANAYIRVEPAGPSRKPKSPGAVQGGARFNYVEKEFAEDPWRHSRYVSGTVEVNDQHKDYRVQAKESDETQLAYAVLMIGKETVAFNDKSGMVDDYLERLLSFYFELRNKLSGSLTPTGKRPPGRPKKVRI